ncbi:MAG: hypothetical protein AABX30_01295 [Nanoarchaeota archaeon]
MKKEQEYLPEYYEEIPYNEVLREFRKGLLEDLGQSEPKYLIGALVDLIGSFLGHEIMRGLNKHFPNQSRGQK